VLERDRVHQRVGAVERARSGHPSGVTEPDPDAPQPRDIALEQPSPELLRQVAEESEPEDQQGHPDAGSS
jgi:hypothetical protein